MTHVAEPACWLALIYASNLSLGRIKAVIGRWCLEDRQPLAALFDVSAAEMAARTGLTSRECETVLALRNHLPRHVDWVHTLIKAGVRVVTRADAAYPAALASGLVPPMQPQLLFCRGNMSVADESLVAIVGEREADRSLVGLASDLAALLAEHNIGLVSGMSMGVGRASVEGALAVEGGRSLVVLPMGISTLEVDHDLAQAIEQGRVLLLSPFHPQVAFSEANAVARNHLITAFAGALVVIQADGQGPVRDMADNALRLGKSVFVWEPDPTDGQAGAGNRSLIEAGGLPVSDIAEAMDMVDSLTELAGARRASSAASTAVPGQAAICKGGQDAMDRQAVLDVLSRSGHVPDALRRRLGQG